VEEVAAAAEAMQEQANTLIIVVPAKLFARRNDCTAPSPMAVQYRRLNL